MHGKRLQDISSPGAELLGWRKAVTKCCLMKNVWLIAEDTSPFLFFTHHVTMISETFQTNCQMDMRLTVSKSRTIKIKMKKKINKNKISPPKNNLHFLKCECYFCMMNWSSKCCQTRVQKSVLGLSLCVRVSVLEWVIQLQRFGNTEPRSQAILAGGVGVRQDTSPRGGDKRGSRDDGESGRFLRRCDSVNLQMTPGARRAARPDCVGFS